MALKTEGPWWISAGGLSSQSVMPRTQVRISLNFTIQCPLGFGTLDKAAALGLATATPSMDLRQYINSDLGYNDLQFRAFFTKIATVSSFEVAISNAWCFDMLDSALFNQISFGNSDRAAYSDLNPRDGGQSLYPMSTVLLFQTELMLLFDPIFWLKFVR